MKTLTELDKLGADLLLKMPEILQKGTAYGDDLFVRFITYSIVKESLMMVIGCLLLISIYFVVKWTRKILGEEEWVEAAASILPTMYIMIVLILGSSMFFSGLFRLIEAIFIPELYIINTFK